MIGALFAPVYVFLLPSIDLLKDIPIWQRLTRHIDWMGNVLFIGGISCFIMAVTFGGTSYTWASANEIALWIAAGILLSSFALSQAFNPLIDTQYRLYPVKLLKYKATVLLQLAIFMSSVGLLVSILVE